MSVTQHLGGRGKRIIASPRPTWPAHRIPLRKVDSAQKDRMEGVTEGAGRKE